VRIGSLSRQLDKLPTVRDRLAKQAAKLVL